VEQEKAQHHVATLCRVVGVSPSGYYAWCKRSQSARATRVARLMNRAGLEGAQRRRYRGTTRQNANAVAAPDLVKRDFTASGPDQLWVADMTYVTTGEGWLYLATVLDVWSRRVVGWAMGDMLRAELVVDALNMAVWNQQPAKGVVHHSDRGAQYTSLAFTRGVERPASPRRWAQWETPTIRSGQHTTPLYDCVMHTAGTERGHGVVCQAVASVGNRWAAQRATGHCHPRARPAEHPHVRTGRRSPGGYRVARRSLLT
jgi:putative transposase